MKTWEVSLNFQNLHLVTDCLVEQALLQNPTLLIS